MDKIVDYIIRVEADNPKVFGIVGGRIKALQLELMDKFPLENIEFFKSYKGERNNQKISINKSR